MATEKDRVNTGLLGAITAILVLSVLGVSLAVMALVRSAEDEQVLIKSADAEKLKNETLGAQDTELTQPAGWADKAKGTATLPIDRAMGLVVEKIQANPEWATPPAPVVKDAGSDAETTDAETDAGAEDAAATATDAATDAGAQGETPAAPAAADAAQAPAAEAGAP